MMRVVSGNALMLMWSEYYHSHEEIFKALMIITVQKQLHIAPWGKTDSLFSVYTDRRLVGSCVCSRMR